MPTDRSRSHEREGVNNGAGTPSVLEGLLSPEPSRKPRQVSQRPNLGARARGDQGGVDPKNVVDPMQAIQDIMRQQQEMARQQNENFMNMFGMMMQGLQRLQPQQATAGATMEAPPGIAGASTEAGVGIYAHHLSGAAASSNGGESSPRLEEWDDDVTELIHQQQKELENKIRRFMIAKKREETRQKDLDIFEADKEFVRYPAGLKACVVNRTEAELEEVWSGCLSEKKTINIRVPKGSNRRSG